MGRRIRELRTDIGPSKFGYLVQGLLVHVFGRLRFEVEAVYPQGHPDIIVWRGGLKTRFEVEVLTPSTRSYLVKEEDLDAIRPANSSEEGYLALLDISKNPSWLLIPWTDIRVRGPKSHRLSLLRWLRDVPFSDDCTGEFQHIVQERRLNLRGYSFPLLVRWARDGRIL